MLITAFENTIKNAAADIISVPDTLATACTITLIVLLAIRELIGAYSGPRLKLTRRLLLIVIIPLLFVFALIVSIRIMDVW